MQEIKEITIESATRAVRELDEWLALPAPVTHPDLKSDVRQLCRSLRQWLGWDG